LFEIKAIDLLTHGEHLRQTENHRPLQNVSKYKEDWQPLAIQDIVNDR